MSTAKRRKATLGGDESEEWKKGIPFEFLLKCVGLCCGEKEEVERKARDNAVCPKLRWSYPRRLDTEDCHEPEGEAA